MVAVNKNSISHFQHDGTTIECSAPVLLQIQLATLCFQSRKEVEEKKSGSDRDVCSLKRMFLVSLTGVFGGLTQAFCKIRDVWQKCLCHFQLETMIQHLIYFSWEIMHLVKYKQATHGQ